MLHSFIVSIYPHSLETLAKKGCHALSYLVIQIPDNPSSNNIPDSSYTATEILLIVVIILLYLNIFRNIFAARDLLPTCSIPHVRPPSPIASE